MCMYVCLCVYVPFARHRCTPWYVHACVCVCVYVFMYVCVCVCMYIYIVDDLHWSVAPYGMFMLVCVRVCVCVCVCVSMC